MDCKYKRPQLPSYVVVATSTVDGTQWRNQIVVDEPLLYQRMFRIAQPSLFRTSNDAFFFYWILVIDVESFRTVPREANDEVDCLVPHVAIADCVHRWYVDESSCPVVNTDVDRIAISAQTTCEPLQLVNDVMGPEETCTPFTHTRFLRVEDRLHSTAVCKEELCCFLDGSVSFSSGGILLG